VPWVKSPLRGENHPYHKLSLSEVREIREKYDSGFFKQRQLAEHYGVTQSLISQIFLGKIWAGNLLEDQTK